MRLYEFIILFEYDRNITMQRIGNKIEMIAQNNRVTPEQAIETIENIDPTKNKQHVLWLVKQLMAKQFRLEDANRINQLLTNYLNIKPRLPQNERDIGKFDLYKLDELVDKHMNASVSTDANASNQGTFPVVPNSKVLYNGPFGQLAIPETEEASCELGRGTKWCTAADKDNFFSSYSSNETPLYVWRDKNGKKYQFWFPEDDFNEFQFMVAQDKPISPELIKDFRTKHPVLSKFFKEKEKEIIKNNDMIVDYARSVIKGRWPEVEPIIMQNPMDARYYASAVLKGRWPEAEPVIMKDPEEAFNYAEKVIKGRWPEAEPYILNSPWIAALYASIVMKKRWPEAEPILMKHADAAGRYARDILKGRWPEAEPYIMKEPHSATGYAREVIHGRWPEAEPYIMKEPYAAQTYATYILKGRWPEAEPYIKTDKFAWQNYQKNLGSNA